MIFYIFPLTRIKTSDNNYNWQDSLRQRRLRCQQHFEQAPTEARRCRWQWGRGSGQRIQLRGWHQVRGYHRQLRGMRPGACPGQGQRHHSCLRSHLRHSISRPGINTDINYFLILLHHLPADGATVNDPKPQQIVRTLETGLNHV